MKSYCLTLIIFLCLAPTASNAQYISRAEPQPYSCPVVCQGGTLFLRVFYVQNVAMGSTIQALMSNVNGSFASGTTTLEATRYTFDSSTWFNGPYVFSGDVSELFLEFTIPQNFPVGNQYTLKIKSSGGFTSADGFQCGGINAVTVTPYVAPLAAVPQTDEGVNKWIGHIYTWTATTGSLFSTPMLVAQQSFFSPSNYKGHILKNALNIDVPFSSSGGAPGSWTDGTSIGCGNSYTNNFSMRWLRKELFSPGVYRIEIAGDDGIRLSIDGGVTWILDSFTEQAYAGSFRSTATANPNGICLSGATHLVVEYFQRPAEARMTVSFIPLSTTAAINVTASGPLELCEGQTVTLTANPVPNGMVWSTGATTPSITVSAAATYFASAENGTSCPSGSGQFVVTETSTAGALAIAADGSLTVCPGESVTLTIQPGVSNILWSTGATSSSITVTETGSYSATANSSGGCALSSDPVEVSVGTGTGLLNVSASGPLSFCVGQSVTLTADAGFTGYEWSTSQNTASIMITQAGTYSVSAHNSGGCEVESQDFVVVIDNNQGGVLSVTPSGEVSICEGESATLTAASGFSAYSWSNGAQTQAITVTESGNYSASGDNATGCDAVSEIVVVTVVFPPVAGFTYQQQTGYSVSFTNTSTSGETYFWDFNNGFTTSAQNVDFTYPFEGNYPVTLIVTNDCGSDTIEISVTVLKQVGIDEMAWNPDLIVSPNPSNSLFTISTTLTKAENLDLSIYNAIGQLVSSKKWAVNGKASTTIDLGNVVTGVYFLTITGLRGQHSYKLIRQ